MPRRRRNESEPPPGVAPTPDPGFAILRARLSDKDPNREDVRPHDLAKHLKERFWIERWLSSGRWKKSEFVSVRGRTELRLAELGRRLDQPGDAFFDLIQTSRKGLVSVRTWVEVTEAVWPDDARGITQAMRALAGQPQASTEEAQAFRDAIDPGVPGGMAQARMADRVVEAVVRKARKGRDGGSYAPLVRDYGGGVLIVGVPLWFPVLAHDRTDPRRFETDFSARLGIGLRAIRRTILNAKWCPFDSVVVLWCPTREALREWAGAAVDPESFVPRAYEWLKDWGLIETTSAMDLHLRWDRYRSLEAAVAAHQRRIRWPGMRRPFGPKAQFKIRPEHPQWKAGWCRLLGFAVLFRGFLRMGGGRDIRRSVNALTRPSWHWKRWKVRRGVMRFYRESVRSLEDGSNRKASHQS